MTGHLTRRRFMRFRSSGQDSGRFAGRGRGICPAVGRPAGPKSPVDRGPSIVGTGIARSPARPNVASSIMGTPIGPWDKHPLERKQGAQHWQDVRVAQAVAQAENRRLAQARNRFRNQGDKDDPQACVSRIPPPRAASAAPPSRRHQDWDVPAAPPRSGPGMSRTVPRRPPVRPGSQGARTQDSPAEGRS